MEKSVRALEEELSRLNREFAILHAISQTVNQSVNQDEILNKSLDTMMEMIEVWSAGIFLLDENENDLICVTGSLFVVAGAIEQAEAMSLKP